MAAATSSLSLSHAFLSRSTTTHCSSHQHSRRLALIAKTPIALPLSVSRVASRAAIIRAAAAETLQKADTGLVDKSVNTIRFLAIDAVEKANSGHPGLPMGCAPVGHVLYDEVMRYNPKNP